MKKTVLAVLSVFFIFCMFTATAGATPKYVDAIPSCDGNGNVTIPPLPAGTTFLNVEIYDDVRGIKPRMIGPVSTFQLEEGASFNFLWKDSEDCVWYQMITPYSKVPGLLTDCSDPRGCKYTYEGSMSKKSATPVMYSGHSQNVYDGSLPDNSKPCGNAPCDNVAKIVPAPVIQQATPAPAPAVTTSVAVARKSSPAVKRPRVEKCDPCVEIAKVKTDTEVIRNSVGEATPEEKASGLGDLHKKETKQLEINKETQGAVGKDTPKEGAKSKSLHEKEDENRKLLEKIDAKIPPLSSPNDSSWIVRILKEFWLVWALLILLLAFAGNHYYRRTNP